MCRLFQALNVVLFVTFSGPVFAVTESYEYSFALEGEQFLVNSMEEVHSALEAAGPEYAVLEIAEEYDYSDTLTLLVLRAPTGVGQLTDGYGIIARPPWDYQFYDSVLKLSLEEAELWLQEFTSNMAQTTNVESVYGYSGHTSNYQGVQPYRAYIPYSDHPSFAGFLPSSEVQVLPLDAPWPSTQCDDYVGGPAVSIGNDVRLVNYGPGVSGKLCEERNGTKWILTQVYVSTINTVPTYDCPDGYRPDYSALQDRCENNVTVYVLREKVVECPVEPPTPLEELIAQYHADDPEMAQLTRDLENGANLSLRDMLTENTQQVEACVSAKFAAGGFTNYGLTSAVRPLAYQAHFHNLMQRWKEHGDVDEDSPEWEACAERREQVELEVGKRINSEAREWNTPGGRDHRIVSAAEPGNSKHSDGKAFDASGVDDVKAYLAKDGPPALTVQDWVNQPTDCNVGWGGLYSNPDEVHFYLREGEQQMEFIALIAALTAGMELELPPNMHHGEPQFARLLVSGEHVDGEVIYHYTIVNQHPDKELIHLTLGIDYENGGGTPDLVEKPVGTEIMIEPHPTQPGFNEFWAEMPESAWNAPPHWALHFIKLEFYPRFYLEFWLQRASKQASIGEVQPGQQLEGFSIHLPKMDPSYLESGFEARFYYPAGQYFGYPEKLDTTPPELSVAVDRSELWPPNNKLIDINVNINVTDDYDGQPPIKLVSITANEPLEEGDIQGADIGADDRSFQLRASRSGNNPDGRIYTITYEAMDAMGNAVQETVTVTVPHDRRR